MGEREKEGIGNIFWQSVVFVVMFVVIFVVIVFVFPFVFVIVFVFLLGEVWLEREVGYRQSMLAI